MPARIVIVLSEPGLAREAAEGLAAAGYDAAALPDPMAALNAMEEEAARIELLVTSFNHQSGTPNGIALARMARSKQPGIKVIFVGTPELAHYATGLGRFESMPLTVPRLVEVAVQMLEAEPESGAGR